MKFSTMLLLSCMTLFSIQGMAQEPEEVIEDVPMP